MDTQQPSAPFGHATVPGEDLQEAFQSGRLEELLSAPNDPAVYLWLRKLTPPSTAIANQENFVTWLSDQLSRPQGVVEGPLKHMGTVRLVVGGASLDQKGESKKIDGIRELANSRQARMALKSFLSTLDDRVVLYVGETSSLMSRLEAHLGGTSGFAKRALQSGFKWEELRLRYYSMPGSTLVQRQALERSLAILTLAPTTSRSG